MACHEEFITILNEKEKYEKMKEEIRTIKSSDKLDHEEGKKSKIVKMHKIKKESIFFIMHKIFKVTTETFAKNCVHTIKVNKTDNKSVLWIKMIDMQKKLDA